MTHKLAFAIALLRSSDSAPIQDARFYGEQALNPVEKSGGLYVFNDIPVCSVRAECRGMIPVQIEPSAGKLLSVCMYEGQGFPTPYGRKILEFYAATHKRMYIGSPEDAVRVLESSEGHARLAVRRGATVGGWLMFTGSGGRTEPAFILEKQMPDKYYLLGHSGGFNGGFASRIYVGMADENGVCRIVLPADFSAADAKPLDTVV